MALRRAATHRVRLPKNADVSGSEFSTPARLDFPSPTRIPKEEIFCQIS